MAKRVELEFEKPADSAALGFRLLAWTVKELGKISTVGLGEILKFAENGVAVRRVEARSAADKAGLLPWDVVQELNGWDVREWTVQDLERELRKLNQIKMVVLRDDTAASREADLGLGPAPAPSKTSPTSDSSASTAPSTPKFDASKRSSSTTAGAAAADAPLVAATPSGPMTEEDCKVGARVMIEKDSEKLLGMCKAAVPASWGQETAAAAGRRGVVTHTTMGEGETRIFCVRLNNTGMQCWVPLAGLSHSSAAAPAAEIVSPTSPQRKGEVAMGGLGMVLHQLSMGGPVKVAQLVPGGVAELCGLFKCGDEITYVNEHDVRNTNAGYVRKKILGKVGSRVTVGAMRKVIGIGEVEFAATLQRSAAGVRASPAMSSEAMADELLPKMEGVQRVSVGLRRAANGSCVDGARLLAWTVGELPHGSPYRDLLDFASDGGIALSKVNEGSAAFESGLRAWDVIQRVDTSDVRLWSVGDVTSLLTTGGAEGAVVFVSVLRSVKTLDKAIELGFTPASAAVSAAASGRRGSSASEASEEEEDEFDLVGSQMTAPRRSVRGWMRRKYREARGYSEWDGEGGASEEMSRPMSMNEQKLTPPHVVTIAVNLPRVAKTGMTACYWCVHDLDAQKGGEALVQLFGFAKEYGGGLPIKDVREGSTAETAGLVAWDVIVKVGSEDVRHLDAMGVQEKLRACDDIMVPLTVMRDLNIKTRRTEIEAQMSKKGNRNSGSRWGLLDGLKAQ